MLLQSEPGELVFVQRPWLSHYRLQLYITAGRVNHGAAVPRRL